MRAFEKQPPPVEVILIDRSTMARIRDRANRIWQETKKPNANLIMFQALKDEMESRGAKANFVMDAGDL